MYENPPSFGWTRGDRGGIHPGKGWVALLRGTWFSREFCPNLARIPARLLRDSCLARRIHSTSRANFVARLNIYITDRSLPVFLSSFFFIFLEFSSFSQLAKLWRELSRSWWALRTFVAWTQTRCVIIAIAVSISKQVRRNDVALNFIFFLVFFSQAMISDDDYGFFLVGGWVFCPVCS